MLVSAVLVFGTSKAFAADFTVGNDTSVRDNIDSYTNFTIIDTNHPAEFTGHLTSFDYYASNTNHFRFVVVDENKVVKWVSEEITPSTGVHTFTPGTPVHVEDGWNVGMYFVSTGTIPYNSEGSASYWEPNNSGLPDVGDTINVETGFSSSTTDRTYSFVANGHTEENNDNDNNGENEGNGVERVGDYKNHGQYVKSQEDKREAAHSRNGMPVQSNGHTK